MENCIVGSGAKFGGDPLNSSHGTALSRPVLLHWITSHDLEAMRDALSQGCLPLDFERKLNRLAQGNLSDHFIEQNCRLFAGLLMTMEDGSFREGNLAERERLLRVLAYVRKDDDAIPDYKPSGFADDQREIRAATVELCGLIQAFKVWRLRNQVPAMWSMHLRNSSQPSGRI